MSSTNYLQGHSSTAKAPGSDDSWAGKEPGPYIAVVKNNRDPLYMGRLQVNIPALSKTTDPVADNLITCEYLSPFFGNKDVSYNIPGSTKYTASQHSYGFWAVPPDIGTKVLVILAEGKMDQAFWIGCVQDPVTNHMVPGIAASEKTWDKSSGGAAGQFSSDVDKQKTYGTTNVPSGELNRADPKASPDLDYNKFNKPIHPLANVLAEQGLSADDVRGTTSSSARRETPSQVFGFSTPGPIDTSTTEQPVGVKDKPRNDFVSRGIGHTFVMDDGDVEGKNQLTRLRTASGHQLLMNDSEGVVYLANGSGKAFIEMESDGTVSVFSDEGINVRTKGEFNLHSDTNINFHAGGSINYTAEGNLALNAEKYIYVMGESGILNAAQKGSVRHYAKDGITSFTDGPQLHGSGRRIDLAGKQVHFNSVKAQSTWGPSWLVPDNDNVGIKETIGEIDVDSAQPLKNGKPNKIESKTTVSDFVTHEPYERTSSTALKKKLINDTLKEIDQQNPDLSPQERKNLKNQLTSTKSIDGISSKIQEVASLNKDFKFALASLKNIESQAKDIKSKIQSRAVSFVKGKIAEGISQLKSKFRFF